MNYTKNYHLPQWVETDRIQMQDFNQMCADMEAGLLANKAAADAGIAAAQATADAAFSPSRKPHAAGSYVGTGASLAITLGFRPSFVIITGMKIAADSLRLEEFGRYAGITAGNNLVPRLTFSDTGFTVTPSASGAYYPDFTESGRVYEYIAFQ